MIGDTLKIGRPITLFEAFVVCLNIMLLCFHVLYVYIVFSEIRFSDVSVSGNRVSQLFLAQKNFLIFLLWREGDGFKNVFCDWGLFAFSKCRFPNVSVSQPVTPVPLTTSSSSAETRVVLIGDVRRAGAAAAALPIRESERVERVRRPPVHLATRRSQITRNEQ